MAGSGWQWKITIFDWRSIFKCFAFRLLCYFSGCKSHIIITVLVFKKNIFRLLVQYTTFSKRGFLRKAEFVFSRPYFPTTTSNRISFPSLSFPRSGLHQPKPSIKTTAQRKVAKDVKGFFFLSSVFRWILGCEVVGSWILFEINMAMAQNLSAPTPPKKKVCRKNWKPILNMKVGPIDKSFRIIMTELNITGCLFTNLYWFDC